MSIMISALIKSIKAAASFVPGINHRAVDFVCHYVGGTQTPMCLTDEEIQETKTQVLDALKWGCYDPDTRKGWVACPHDGEWLTHPTKGVVGGFLFEVVGETAWNGEEEYKILVCKCWDEWDFNPVQGSGQNGAARLELPPSIPSSVLAAGRAAAKTLGVKIKIDTDGVYVCEEDLVRFNDKHRFRTEWEFEISQWDLIPEENEEEEVEDNSYHYSQLRLVSSDYGVGLATHKGETFNYLCTYTNAPWRGYMCAEDLP